MNTYVNGTASTSKSIFCFRNSCKLSLSRPLYHALGYSPSGSPVPGTMKPSSRRDSGVGRGEAVYAITSLPIARATRATVGRLASKFVRVVNGQQMVGESCRSGCCKGCPGRELEIAEARTLDGTFPSCKNRATWCATRKRKIGFLGRCVHDCGDFRGGP